MSFTGASSATTASTAPTGTLGDVPPVTFPGVASGIDYNSIIQKYTAATQAAEVPYQDQLNNLTTANTEILKLQSLLGAVQDSLTALSNPVTFQAYKATPSITGVVNATQISGQSAVPGTYTIDSQVAATATSIVNNSAANKQYTLAQYTSGSPALDSIGASITPTNGTLSTGLPSTSGSLTINGVKITYDVSTDSLQAIVNRINASGAGVNATYNANGTVTLAATTAAGIALGSAADTGNLIQVLHLDTAQIVGTGAAQTITSSSPIAGINQFTTLQGSGNPGTLPGGATVGSTSITVSSAVGYQAGEVLRLDAGTGTQEDVTIASVSGNVVTLSAATTKTHGAGATVTPLGGNAGFATVPTSGTFTINGVQLTINAATQSLNDVLGLINTSSAGVTASFNPNSDQIVLTNKTPGNQNIVLGSSSDTSNFLSAAGLSSNSTTIPGGSALGATTLTVGSTAGYGTGETLRLDAGTGTQEDVTIASISGNVITLTAPTAFAHGAGATVATLNAGQITTGTQASLTYQGPTGAPVTVYSATNAFTSVVPGIDLTVTSTTTTPYTVTVANDPSAAEKAIGAFVTAYNAAITELNTATAAPIIATGTVASTGQQASAAASKGGSLYRDFEVSGIRDQLVQLVSGFLPSGNSSYNSLQSIGLSLDTATTSAGAVDANDTTSSASTGANSTSTQNLSATSGKLQVLNTTTFEAAIAANSSAVEALFTSTTGGLAQQLGSQLTLATGLPTFLSTGLADAVPSQSLLQTVEDSNTIQIDTLKQQISLINDEAVQQANSLRAQFSASETQIAELQALQAQISAIGH